MTTPGEDTTIMACTTAVEGLAQLALNAQSIRKIVSRYSTWSELYELGTMELIGLIGAAGRIEIPPHCPRGRAGEIGVAVSYLDESWPDALDLCHTPLALVEMGGVPSGPYINICGPRHPSPVAIRAVRVIVEKASEAGFGICATADGTGIIALRHAGQRGIRTCVVVHGDGAGSARACGGIRERYLACELRDQGGAALHLRHFELDGDTAEEIASNLSELTVVVEPRLPRSALEQTVPRDRVLYVQGDAQYGFSAEHMTHCMPPETVSFGSS